MAGFLSRSGGSTVEQFVGGRWVVVGRGTDVMTVAKMKAAGKVVRVRKGS